MLRAMLQPGMGHNPAKFEETWKAWGHQVDVYEHSATSKRDDDVTISVMLHKTPRQLAGEFPTVRE